jgi:hypothetical protein
MHENTGAKSIAIARQEYSTNISEEYEYSHEKAERVSLPHKPFIIANKTKNKKQLTLQE